MACSVRQAHFSTQLLRNSANIVSEMTMALVTLYHPKPEDSAGAVRALGFTKVVKNDSIDFSIISTMVGIDAMILVAK